MAEILASLDDINSNLDQNVVEADEDNTGLIQISVSRIVRGFLNGAIDNVTLQTWRAPEVTPEIIREAAGKLIAAQHYYNEISKTENVIEPNSYAQKLYDRGMELLNGILTGEYVIIDPITDVVIGSSDSMSALDFHPIDSTDRAFTMGMLL